MCGIVGLIDFERALPAEAQVAAARAMIDSIRHRGPDHGDVWCDAAAGVALGYRRLAILDLSPAGQQPMASADGRYVMVYNGEVYNYRDFRSELEARGHGFRGHSDTEAMLAAIATWGIEATVERFNGMFAFAVWDRQERRLWLARDPVGIKPLYYGRWQGALVFGSELKALRCFPGFAPAVDRSAQASYLRLGYIPAPQTMYEGIAKLPPGALLRVDADGTQMLRRYWTPEGAFAAGQADPFSGSIEEAADALEALLRDAVNLQMISDVPLGAFLSGGVDSSTVTALMQAQSDRPVKTFTISFREGMYNEAPFAAAVARHLGTDHNALEVTPTEAQAVIERLPGIYDEPYADSSAIPTFLVSQLARRQVTVSLSGDGGDELFAGYERYVWARGLAARAGRIPQPARRLVAAAIRSVPHAAWDSIGAAAGRRRAGDKVHKLAGALDFRSPSDLYRRMHTLWPQPGALVAGAAEPPSVFDEGGISVGAQSTAAPQGDAYVRWMQRTDLALYLPDDVLTKVDRASMAASLEARVPLLDTRVIAFAARLPLEYTLGKRVLRQVLYRYVPPALIERPKAGFGVPIGDWLRGPLRAWAEARLDARRLTACGITSAPVRAAWAEHLAGRGAWAQALWAVCLWG